MGTGPDTSFAPDGARKERDGKRTRVVVYTPVYFSSPGTRYRVDRLVESIASRGTDFRLVIDESEGFLKRLYGYMAPRLLTKKTTWELVGRRISRRVARFRPDLALLITDVTAGAAKYLMKDGIRTIVSVEDYTTSYHPAIRNSQGTASAIMKILKEELGHAEHVITPASTLSTALREDMGLKPVTVPIGLRMEVRLAEAEKRPREWALHARPIRERRQAVELSRVAEDLNKRGVKVIAQRAGRYAAEVKGVQWYSFPSPEEAMALGKKAFVGIVNEFRPAFTLSTLYFHSALLQPMIALGDGPWVEEARNLCLPLIGSIDEIDPGMIRSMEESSLKLEVPQAHAPLLDLI